MATDPLLKWRSEFPILDRKAGYLISNSLGAMPRKVAESHQRGIADRFEDVLVVMDAFEYLAHARRLLGGFGGMDGRRTFTIRRAPGRGRMLWADGQSGPA